MQKIIFIIFIIHLSTLVHSQKIFNYHYKTNEHIRTSIDSIPFLGMENEILTTRKYLNFYIFSENQLFTGSEKKAIMYKVEKGIWYYKSRNKWKLLYDYNTMKGGKISFSKKEKYILNFTKVVIIRNQTLHKIELEPYGILQSNHRPEYYFSPFEGFIIIKVSNGTLLIRSDIFEYPLTNDEINLF